jgi:hypothetical protein
VLLTVVKVADCLRSHLDTSRCGFDSDNIRNFKDRSSPFAVNIQLDSSQGPSRTVGISWKAANTRLNWSAGYHPRATCQGTVGRPPMGLLVVRQADCSAPWCCSRLCVTLLFSFSVLHHPQSYLYTLGNGFRIVRACVCWSWAVWRNHPDLTGGKLHITPFLLALSSRRLCCQPHRVARRGCVF